jgi:hypothetical protein
MSYVHGHPIAAAIRVKVERISDHEVVLRVRAVPAQMETNPRGTTLHPEPKEVSLDHAGAVHYGPGESLAIPIEGGTGTVYIKGDVMDHQPKLAFGSPLEPGPDKMSVRSPVLLESDHLLGVFPGSSFTGNRAEGVTLSLHQDEFTFALQPFPGAIKGEANWGEIKFKLDGNEYRLISAAPITGGDQPRPIWVRHSVSQAPEWVCPSTCNGWVQTVK